MYSKSLCYVEEEEMSTPPPLARIFTNDFSITDSLPGSRKTQDLFACFTFVCVNNQCKAGMGVNKTITSLSGHSNSYYRYSLKLNPSKNLVWISLRKLNFKFFKSHADVVGLS